MVSAVPLCLGLLLTWGDVVYPWYAPFLVSMVLVALGLGWLSVRAAPASLAPFMPFLLLAFWWLTLWATARALPSQKESFKRVSCLSNIKQLGIGMALYAEDHDRRLPPADTWGTATLPYTEREFRCPSATSPWSYAMNSGASGLPVELEGARLRGPSDLVLLFEADAQLRNASGGPEWLVFRHEGKTNVGFADTHVKAFTEEGAATLRWKP
ncbi:MAG: hypothetical protein M9921_02845 [Fimbriimonadaceae bacterium]|nr:hypothetical protein [Chthonomonadaceae bacterium]MCO5295771.1 hypothetical protein [Fimbriimonadaceae bacterium]